MANWKQKINLNQILEQLSEEFDLSEVERPCPTVVKNKIANEVERVTVLKPFGKQIRKSRSIAAVNRILEQVFQVADENLVWCGM